MFHAESIELLNEIEECLLDIQENGINKENINAIFRTVHSIKWGAGMFELKQLIQFSNTVVGICTLLSLAVRVTPIR
jgi:two-component system chemotaxis sensor kinase CheA